MPWQAWRGCSRSRVPPAQINIDFAVGYGFTDDHRRLPSVRLHPVGIVLAGFLLALTFIGGELAQFMLGLPSASIQVFQGMLLFFLLALDLLTNYPHSFQPRGGARDGPDVDQSRRACGSANGGGDADPAGGHRRAGGGRKAGVLNLGVEGMMIVGAVFGLHRRGSERQPLSRHGRRGDRGRWAWAPVRAPDPGASRQPGRPRVWR